MHPASSSSDASHWSRISANAAYAAIDSAAAPRAVSTTKPWCGARSTASSHSVVFPIPGSPPINRADGSRVAEGRKSLTARTSAARQTNRDMC